MSVINPSKGVEYYTFNAKKDFTVSFKAPTDLGLSHSVYNYETDTVKMQYQKVEISEIDVSILKHTGTFRWDVNDKNGDSVEHKFVEIAPLTGNIGNTNIEKTLDQNVIIDNDYIISYGFYDASSGHFSALTNHDQSYVYVTPPLKNWMGDCIAQNAKFGDFPFTAFVLPGSHDSGMYNNDQANALIQDKEYTNFLTGNKLGADYLDTIIQFYGEDAIIGSSMTQKDDITQQLSMGIRYFDIRPGFCAYADSFEIPSSVDDALKNPIKNLYHQHKIVPGKNFDQILKQALNWLDENPTEIIVISLNFQGIDMGAIIPCTKFLDAYIKKVAENANSKVNSTDKSDLTNQTSYNQLISENKRLIFLNQLKEDDDASKYDSYSKDYETTDVNNIIKALKSMTKEGQEACDYTVLQLQGTANAVISNDIDTSIGISHLSSPLMSTKAMFDNATYPWIDENVANNFHKSKLLVLLNDFADNALAYKAKNISTSRFNKYLND